MDIVIVFLVFLFFIWIKPASKRVYLPTYIVPFLFFLCVWIFSSSLFGKFKVDERLNFKKAALPVISSNVFAVALVLGLMYFLNLFSFSRLIVFGTILVSTSVEIIFALILSYVSRANEQIELDEVVNLLPEEITVEIPREQQLSDEALRSREQKLEMEIGKVALNFIERHINIANKLTFITNTDNRFTIENLIYENLDAILNVEKVNNFRFINKFFEAVNERLNTHSVFVGRFESKDLRKKRIFRKYIWGFNYIIYFFDYTFNRVFPKLPVFKRIYFFLTKGKNRVLSKAECFGRLYSCGFSVVDEFCCDKNYLYFVAKKVRQPFYDLNPTYGPFIKLNRIGKRGDFIKVYKFRTMHPYAEYLQEYIYEKGNLADGGKFKDDFRITTQGKIMRKLWLDELPMLYNFIKGQLKLVGVRPLSKHYFSLYSKEVQELRKKVKPGLIPPFYYDMPETLEEIQNSEKVYIEKYLKNPLRTDWKYFWKAFYNIVFRGARSN